MMCCFDFGVFCCLVCCFDFCFAATLAEFVYGFNVCDFETVCGDCGLIVFLG